MMMFVLNYKVKVQEWDSTIIRELQEKGLVFTINDIQEK